jgi:phage terminase large subunit
MSKLQIQIPPKLIPVFTGPAMYRGSYGGRGSGKTRTFAKMLAVRGRMFAEEGKSGLLVGVREYMNSLDESSMAEIKAAILSEPWLEEFYEIGEKFIRSRDRLIDFDFVGLSRNLDSIKSKSRILILWADEAEPISENAWEKVDPTVREEGSEIWVTWNPEWSKSATHRRFRENPPPHSKIVQLNWRDNPWFPKELQIKREHAFKTDPDNYEHIWEGAFKTVQTGAYYAKQITAAKAEGRISRVSADPLLPIRLVADIGGTGRLSDSFVFWAVQFVGREIRWLNHYEAQGQEIGHHLNWMRANKYTPERAQIILPHDGSKPGDVYNISYKSAFESAGYDVDVIENQGPGAAMLRVEALRRVFPMCWFNEDTTKPGLEALGWYHEKIDDKRAIGLGPDHDWASHSADAAGLVAVVYEAPRKGEEEREFYVPRGTQGWMGA